MDKEEHSIESRRFRFGNWIILSCVGVCLTLIPGLGPDRRIMLSGAMAESQGPPEQPDSATAAQVRPAKPLPVNPSVNAVTQTAVKLGILSCVSRINQVATFLTANNQAGVFVFSPQKLPDQHVFSTSFELIRADDSVIYASASFFPNQDAVYDTVEYVNSRCEELEKTVFQHLRRIGTVKKNIIVLDGGTVKVFLMPAGSGTVVIKKEVLQ